MIQIDSKHRKNGAYEPSSQEIARACAEIRARWNLREERKRRVQPVDRYVVPQYSFSELRLGQPE